MTRTFRWPALLWSAAIALSVVQLVLAVTAETSVPLSIAIAALFITAAALTGLHLRR